MIDIPNYYEEEEEEEGTKQVCKYSMQIHQRTVARHRATPPRIHYVLIVGDSIDNLLHVVNYETGEQQEEYKGHFGPVHCVRYSPDGEIYASGSEDGTVRLWQSRVGIEYGLWRFDKGE